MQIEFIKNRKKLIAFGVAGLLVLTVAISVSAFTKNGEEKQTNTGASMSLKSTPTPTIKITPSPKALGKSPAQSNSMVQSSSAKAPTSTPTPQPTLVPTATQTPTPIVTPDNEPPTTNIYYPTDGGELTYKIDGKVCVVATAPSDNISSHPDIQTRFAFNENSLSDYASGRAYLCIDSLPNGSHSIKFQSKDKAGNEESLKSITFTVNIPEN